MRVNRCLAYRWKELKSFWREFMNSSIQWCLKITVFVRLMWMSSRLWTSTPSVWTWFSRNFLTAQWNDTSCSDRKPMKRVRIENMTDERQTGLYMECERKWTRCRVRVENFLFVRLAWSFASPHLKMCLSAGSVETFSSGNKWIVIRKSEIDSRESYHRFVRIAGNCWSHIILVIGRWAAVIDQRQRHIQNCSRLTGNVDTFSFQSLWHSEFRCLKCHKFRQLPSRNGLDQKNFCRWKGEASK